MIRKICKIQELIVSCHLTRGNSRFLFVAVYSVQIKGRVVTGISCHQFVYLLQLLALSSHASRMIHACYICCHFSTYPSIVLFTTVFFSVQMLHPQFWQATNECKELAFLHVLLLNLLPTFQLLGQLHSRTTPRPASSSSSSPPPSGSRQGPAARSHNLLIPFSLALK